MPWTQSTGCLPTQWLGWERLCVFDCLQRSGSLFGLSDYLEGLLYGLYLDLNRTLLPAIYSDGIFGVMLTIVPRFTGRNLSDNQQRWNVRMAKVRIALENLLGYHRNLFRIFVCYSDC
jgi:hypothetical protein